MTSKLTRERLQEIAEDGFLKHGESKELARMALAAMDSESGCLPLDYLQGHKDGLEWAAQLAEANHPETGDWLYDDPIELAKAIRKGPDMPPAQPAADSEPVAWTDEEELRDANAGACGYLFGIDCSANKFADPRRQIMLYRHAQSAPDRDQVRREHAEWSQATFGNVGPVGPLKHLSKEALEAAAEPDDLSEWADMQFLLWDAQRRAGITDEQITKAMIEKLAVNKLRDWPEPKDGEPRLHIKEQPAPVVLKDHEIRELVNQLRDIAIKYHGTGQLRERIAHVIRGAMLQAGNSPVIPDGYRLQPISEYEAMCATVNSDEWPQRWIPVSEQMPEVGDIVLTAMGGVVNVGETECSAANCRFFTSVISGRELPATHWMPLPAAPQEVGDA
ncbi:TPA: DUF550 domain-containing protein [Klebsiella pneumoniae]|nr:DUF550 domain-containing protein [Klebsiella pneumoniae]